MKIIDIDKDMIPYDFEVNLSDKTYQFEVNYNEFGDFFTLDLYKDNELLILGEKIVFGNILFDRYNYLDIPQGMFVYTQNQMENARVTFENFNEDIFIFYMGDLDIGDEDVD